jgi:hypothetical protein
MADHGTDPLPAPVTPTIRTWVPCSRSFHGVPSPRLPTGRADRSGFSGTVSALRGSARASYRGNSKLMSRGPLTVTRQEGAANPCASSTTRCSRSAGAVPATGRRARSRPGRCSAPSGHPTINLQALPQFEETQVPRHPQPSPPRSLTGAESGPRLGTTRLHPLTVVTHATTMVILLGALPVLPTATPQAEGPP